MTAFARLRGSAGQLKPVAEGMNLCRALSPVLQNGPGGFVMEGNKVSASQAIAWAAGPTRLAALNGAKMIRRTPEGLQDIPLPLKKILNAKAPDEELQPDDIIWIPSSKAKSLVGAGTSSIISTLTSLAIYRF